MSVNIFNALKIEEPQTLTRTSRKESSGAPKKEDIIVMSVEEFSKETHPHEKSLKESLKVKGVPSEPHPLDRKSGTGRGKELRKCGQGRHNWGTYKDDYKSYEVFYMSEEEIYQGTSSKEEEESIAPSENTIKKRKRQRKSKIQSVKVKVQERPQGMVFDDKDFPPLA